MWFCTEVILTPHIIATCTDDSVCHCALYLVSLEMLHESCMTAPSLGHSYSD